MARFNNIPEISFLGDITLQKLKEIAVEAYNSEYKSLTGNSAVVISDEDKAVLYTAAQIYYQLAAAVNEKAKQNLLKYATGTYLDNIALSRGLTRKKEEKAIVTIRFTLSAARTGITVIPARTRVTSAACNTYFATDEYAEIPPGELSADVKCTSVTGGAVANEYAVGEINIIVDPIAYVAMAENIDIPTGGDDEESDEAFAERIFNSRYMYSTTGAEKAYIYYIKSFSTLITDVTCENPSDANLVFYILLENEEPANDTFLTELASYIQNPEIKALTDKITIKNVSRVNYSVNVSYGISENDVSHAADIQKEITEAVNKYITWQSAKIGRDIDTQELLTCMRNAGAKGVVITAPTDTVVSNTQVAHCTAVTLEYSGIVYN